MQQDSTASSSWQSVAAELRACRDQQQATWGDLDHALIGRYLAGEVTAEERSLVESSLDQHPELRVLTEVVSEVLGESSPTVEEPAILSFTSARKPARGRFQRYHRHFALAAAACLLLGLGLTLNSSVPSDRGDLSGNNASMTATRDNLRMLGQASHKFHTLSLPDTDLAKVDEWVEKKEYEKAATVLFKQQQPTPPAPTKVAVVNSTRHNHSVAKLTERVLEDMKQAEPQAKPDGSIVFASEYGPNASHMQSYIISQSVPYLVNGLNQKSDSVLRDRSTTVLKQLGPRARQAEKELEELACKDCKIVSPKAREALASVRMPYWVGVKDQAKVLNDAACHRINQRIAELSRKHQVYIVAETVKSLPAETQRNVVAFKTADKKNEELSKWAERRCHAAAAEKGVYVLICMDPPSVQVSVCSEFKKKETQGWSRDIVQARMQDSLAKHDLDTGLEEVVQMIEKAIAK